MVRRASSKRWAARSGSSSSSSAWCATGITRQWASRTGNRSSNTTARSSRYTLSLAQLRGAPASASHYLAARADALPFADGSFDLITVAQALHWFPLPMFFKEAERVLREDALLAIISYGLCQVEGLPDLIDDFHDRVLAPWWPAARWSVVSGYRNVTLPWPEHKAPESLGIERHWHWRDLAAYLDTWSALAKARSFGKDPLRDFLPRLEQAWGEKTRKVRWPLRVRACRRPREY